jgi:hypothetical protein
MLIARRSFLTGLGASLLMAPAIVKASSLMQLRSTKISRDDEILDTLRGFSIGDKVLVIHNPISAQNGVYVFSDLDWKRPEDGLFLPPGARVELPAGPLFA